MDFHQRAVRPAISDWRKWLVFIGYAGAAIFLAQRHETWGDELEAWNVMKSDTSYPNLLFRQAYYLHPTSWNTILYIIAQFSHSLTVLTVTACMTALATAFVVVFLSPFTPLAALAILSGYYFLFEYAVFARGYGFAALLAMVACYAANPSKPKVILYYLALMLLSNTHLFGLFLACAIYMQRLTANWRDRELRKRSVWTGILLFSPAACIDLLAFIQGSSADIPMTIGNRIWNVLQATVRAFVPMPAWWKYHFWNTQFMLEAGVNTPVVKYSALIVSVCIVVLIVFLFRNSNTSKFIVATCLALILVFGLSFPLLSARYVGFLYLAFIATLWLSEDGFKGWRKTAAWAVVLVQIPGGLFSASKEILLPFSQIRSSTRMAEEVPKNIPLITDFGAMNMISGETDKGSFCVAVNRVISCIPLAPRALYLVHCRDRYTQGTRYYLDSTKTNEVYLMSTRSPAKIPMEDKFFFEKFSVEPVDSASGAIEKFSNLYLYRVSRPKQTAGLQE
jgi:hypothetical protein